MAKNKIKINKKYLRKLGLDISVDELPDDACIKRINYSSDPEELVLDADGYTIGVITTIDVDADGDVVIPAGIDLGRYRKNPVVLFNHSLAEPVGYSESLKVFDDKVISKTRYGSTPEAQRIHQLIKDKVLRTHSIGFITLEALFRGQASFQKKLNELKAKYPQKFTEESAKRVDRIVTKSLMVEYSIISIPSNEDAVMLEIKAAKHGKVEEKVTEQPESSEEELKAEVDEFAAVPEVRREPDAEAEPEKKEISRVEIKVLKRATRINKITTVKELEAKRLQKAYLKLWGV